MAQAGSFQRVSPIGDSFIRAPARLLVCPITSAYPGNLTSIVNLNTNPSTYTTEVQTLTMTGSPTGGSFVLAFNSVATAQIPYNATSTQVQTALNALTTINPGGTSSVACGGGPLPTTAITVTFAGTNASSAQPLIQVPSSLQALTGGSSPAVTVTRTTAGFGLYDPVAPWTELGSTKAGVHIDRNNTETMIDVDQILTSLIALPDNWEMTVTTQLAETSQENIQLAWEGGTISTDVTQSPNERHLPFGGPLFYANSQKRLAVIAQKSVGTSAGRIVANVFRIVTRSPQASRLTYDKTGAQQTLPIVFRAFADPSIADPNARFGERLEQIFA
jgi:hypothetical protein